jgi:hypothetical protein
MVFYNVNVKVEKRKVIEAFQNSSAYRFAFVLILGVEGGEDWENVAWLRICQLPTYASAFVFGYFCILNFSV